MAELHLAVFILVADAQTAGLGVTQVGAGAHLKVLLLTGGPGLNVAGLDLQVCQIAGAALQLTHGDVHGTEQLHREVPQLIVPRLGVLGLADHDHLLLLKLVDAVHTALLNAVRALLLAEAGGVGGQRLGQFVGGNDLVDEPADHGVLAGADQIQVLALDLIHHGVHIRLAHNALHHVAVDHEGGDAVGEALGDHEVPAISQHSLVETGNVTQQVVEAGAGDTAGGVHINAVKALHNVRVIGDGEVRHLGLAEALDLYVGGIVRADGHGGVNDLGDLEHDVVDLLVQLSFQLFQSGQPLSLIGDLLLHSLGLSQLAGVLLGLTHQHADLLAQAVAVGTELVRLLNVGPALAVQLDDLIHQRQLLVLKLLLDVFLHNVGIFPDKLNVEHSSFSLIDLIEIIVMIMFTCSKSLLLIPDTAGPEA